MYNFRRLYQIERDCREKVLQRFENIKDNTRKLNDLYERQAKLVGSLQEGGFVARCFKNKGSGENINKAMDIDLELIITTLSDKQRHCIQEIDQKPGFVKLNTNLTNCTFNRQLHYENYITIEEEEKVFKGGFLRPYESKKVLLNGNVFEIHDEPLKIVQAVNAWVFKTKMEEVKILNAREEITKATVSFSMTVLVEDKFEYDISLDAASIIKVDWTPNVTTNWIQRSRNWTDLIGQLSNELRYSYVILKTSNEEKGNNETIELRYSFAHIERKIVELQSDTQRMIFTIFKSIIYQYLLTNELEDIVSSYIAKTTMLWTCEKYPPNDPFWSNDNASILRILKYLITELHQNFDRGFLPYYFIPEINLLGHLPSGIVRKLTSILYNMKHNIEDYLPRHSHEVLDLSELVLSV